MNHLEAANAEATAAPKCPSPSQTFTPGQEHYKLQNYLQKNVLCGSEITCQRRPDEQRDTLHDGNQAKSGLEVAHLHHIHEDSVHQGPHHTHGQPEDDHIYHQHGKIRPNAADTVTEPIDQQSRSEHVNMPPFEPGHVEHDSESRADEDVDHTQDGQHQGSLSLFHSMCRSIRNQKYQRHQKAKHHPGETYGIHTVMSVVAELVKGHVFA